jgi:Glycosyltransferase
MTEIAKHCRVFVITEGEWREEIEAALKTMPQKDNIRMYYNPVSDRVRRMCWNQGDYRFYFHYARWQRKTLEIARGIVRDNHIDIIHQLNMVGFREPGLLWKIKDVPYVWGPFGGAHSINVKYLDSVTSRIGYSIKNIINGFQLRYSPKVRGAVSRAEELITPLREDSEAIMRVFGRKTVLISETGVEGLCVPAEKVSRLDDSFNLLWVGKFAMRKKLDLALRALAMMQDNDNVTLHIVGCGSEKEDEHYRKLADQLGVASHCRWYGRVENDKVHQMMRSMDLLFFSSIHELTSTVVPEAIQNRLPVLCHDAMGFGPLIEEGKTGFKIPLVDPDSSVKGFVTVLDHCKSNMDMLDAMKYNFDEVAAKISYQSKGLMMLNIYDQCQK